MAYVRVVTRPDFAAYTLFCLTVVLILGTATEGNVATDSCIAPTEDTCLKARSENSMHAQNSSSTVECTLLIRNKESMMAQLRNVFSKGAIFVYFKLDFNSTFTMYSNSSYVVDPLTWVLAVDGKGKLLLTYPFDFEQLSLGTLSYGVFHMNLTVAVPHNGCFQKGDDGIKRQIVALLVSELVQSVNDIRMNAEKESLVCFERQLTSEEFDLTGVYAIPLCTYYVFQGSTAYDCWLTNSDHFDSEPMRVRKHGWLGAILAVGFLLAFFSPLAASFFIRKNPPVMINGEQYVGLNSDLPLGLKHLLCFSLQDYSLIVVVRLMVYVSAFMLIPFLPFIISHAIRRDLFTQRSAVAYELLLSKNLVPFYFIIILNVIFLAIIVLFFALYLYDNKLISNYLVVEMADRRYFGFWKNMPENIWVPEKHGETLYIFMFTLLYRTQMAINPAVWIFFFYPVGTYIHSVFGGRGSDRMKNACRNIFTCLAILIVFPFAFLRVLFLLLLNSVPMLYILLFLSSKTLSNQVRASEITSALFILFLSFAIVFIFVAAFVYVAEVIGYTFIGFVLNSASAGPFFVAALTVTGYVIKATTTFYDKYCILLMRVMEAAKRVDSELASKQSQREESSGEETTWEQSKENYRYVRTVRRNRRNKKNVKVTLRGYKCRPQESIMEARDTILLKYKQHISVIPLRLFEDVVAKYQPMYLEVGSILLKLLVMVLVMTFGISTLVFIDGINDLPAVVEFFATAIVAGVIPTLTLILKSPAREENEGTANAEVLEAFLKDYASKDLKDDVRQRDN
ncbi:uncharacterized protein [Diadema setosum]|uniref:uncharacterized protein n=1 Tax=Diadema setosum TaxID=31175 RepID=UPI003B3A2687